LGEVILGTARCRWCGAEDRLEHRNKLVVSGGAERIRRDVVFDAGEERRKRTLGGKADGKSVQFVP
jgi:hypothetical protein